MLSDNGESRQNRSFVSGQKLVNPAVSVMGSGKTVHTGTVFSRILVA